MCPKCDYYMPLSQQTDDDTKEVELKRFCRTCGLVKDEEKGLTMEVVVQEKASESYRVFVNEFTKHDPRLPHVKTLKCPSEQCPSNHNAAEPDVIYIKYDTANMKFLYICNVCNTQWRSRN